jgi:hypothetical protein
MRITTRVELLFHRIGIIASVVVTLLLIFTAVISQFTIAGIVAVAAGGALLVILKIVTSEDLLARPEMRVCVPAALNSDQVFDAVAEWLNTFYGQVPGANDLDFAVTVMLAGRTSWTCAKGQ